MNALEPLPLFLILDFFSDRGVADQMVLVPRFAVDGQRGLVVVRDDFEHALFESLGEVVDPTARRKRGWSCQPCFYLYFSFLFFSFILGFASGDFMKRARWDRLT